MGLAAGVIIPVILGKLLQGGADLVGRWQRTKAINERNINALEALRAFGLIKDGEAATTGQAGAKPSEATGLTAEAASEARPSVARRAKPAKLRRDHVSTGPSVQRQPQRFQAQAGALPTQPVTTQPTRFQPTGQPTLPGIDWSMSAQGELSYRSNDAYHKQLQEMDFAKYYDQQWKLYRSQGKSPREADMGATADATSSYGMIKNLGDFREAYQGMTPEQRFNSARSWTLNRFLDSNPETIEELREGVTGQFPNLSDDDWNKIREDMFEIARAIVMPQHAGLPEDEAWRMASQEAAQILGMDQEKFLTKSMRVSDLAPAELKEALRRGMKPSDIVAPGEPYKAIEQQAFETGQVRTIDTARKRLIASERARAGTAAEIARTMLRKVRQYAESLNTAEGWKRITGKIGMTVKGWWQTSEDKIMVGDREMTVGAASKQYMDWSKVLLAKMARAFGEVGVLTEFDIERAKGAIAALGTGAEVTKIKFDDLDDLFTTLMERAEMIETGEMPDLPGPPITEKQALELIEAMTLDDLIPGNEDRFKLNLPGVE